MTEHKGKAITDESVSESDHTAIQEGEESQISKWPRGSEWRKWDLHVHSPASHGFSGDWNQFVIQLGNADCDVIGINDYFSVSGYRKIQDLLSNPGAGAEGNEAYRDGLKKLRTKTLLPVVECRMNNIVVDKKVKSGPRINFHIVFDPAVDPDNIETFIKSLKVKNASIGTHYNDSKFLLNEVSVNFYEALHTLRDDANFKDRFLIWIPYDEYGGIDTINPATDKLFKEGLVYDADILGSSNKTQADFFLWKDKKFTEEQYEEWFGKKKPCIKGSDSHDVNDELGKLKDAQSQPTEKYCWIKADPTFVGLRQIVNEPEDRVFIGRTPPKLEEVQHNTTRYLSKVHIRKTSAADIDDTWFNCEIPLNFDMVAIIGDKGSGKSALADILALAGNASCDTAHFSFLVKDRFCERNNRIAKQFEVYARWEDGTDQTISLDSKPDNRNVELLRYIPQTYLEKVCTETEPGEESEFQRELRQVIFSHISDANRLGKESLDDLVDYKTEELVSQIDTFRQEISDQNDELIRLEAKASELYVAQLKARLNQKKQELAAHIAAKPATIEKPNSLSPEQQAAITAIGEKLDNERKTLTEIDTKISQNQAKQKTLTEHVALATKIDGKLDNFEADFDRLKADTLSDLQKLELDIDDLITLAINKEKLKQKRASLTAEKATIDASLDDSVDSLFGQRAACEARIKALQDQLDAPNKQYQEYQQALSVWQNRKDAIQGSCDKPETVANLEAQLKYISEELPKEIASVKEQRIILATKVHEATASIRGVFEELFAPVQKLIEGSVIIKEGFKLTFDSHIVERTFQRDFFESYINQGVAGSFCGKDKAATLLEELRADFDFNNAEDAIAFAEKVVTYLEHDMRSSKQGKMDVSSQLRKHVKLQELYGYLWSFNYLEPEYSLKLDGKDLNLLSPGERGTLLLVFYLLVDNRNDPIIVDQPEENLDSKTVYRLLIPVIKEVKKHRQIIMVTHSPNIAVVCDAEQVIHAHIDRANKNEVIYTMGSIESPEINKFLVDVLEGTRPAFDNRDSKYY